MKLIKLLLISVLVVMSIDAKQRVNVNFSNLQINDFVKLISKITKKNILISNKLVGTVDLISNAPIYDTELMGILISVLETKGYTLIEKGSIYEVIRSVDAAKHNAKVVKEGSKTYGSLMVTHSIKVKHENVDIVAAKIRYLISKTAKLMTMKESNIILITDYPKNIETIKKVIKEISANSNIIVKIVNIKNVEAKKIQVKLNTIAKSIFNEKITVEKVNIILDENTNSVILVGNKQNIQKLEKLIKTLDVESTATNGVKIYSLKNSEATSVLKSLNEIISKQTFADPTMKPNVSASEEINAIIAVGDPVAIKGIKHIIDELDKEKYQVYVQARIIEINKKNTEELGIKYGFGGGGGTTSADGLYALSANIGTLSDEALALGVLANKSFGLLATLNFLQTHGASKSVSNPSILCVNNKESSIYVGKTISVQTTSTVGTTGLPTKSFKREDIGLTLKIKPRVSSVDKVGLDVEVILENILSPDADGNPVTSKQEVKTQTILRSGENILIGGLVRTYNVKSVEKIPFLGSIPWIGKWLFTYTSTTKEKDNLMVILTPYVIEKSEMLSELQLYLGVLSKEQQNYNKAVLKEMEKRIVDTNAVDNNENAYINLDEEDEY